MDFIKLYGLFHHHHAPIIIIIIITLTIVEYFGALNKPDCSKLQVGVTDFLFVLTRSRYTWTNPYIVARMKNLF